MREVVTISVDGKGTRLSADRDGNPIEITEDIHHELEVTSASEFDSILREAGSREQLAHYVVNQQENALYGVNDFRIRFSNPAVIWVWAKQLAAERHGNPYKFLAEWQAQLSRSMVSEAVKMPERR